MEIYKKTKQNKTGELSTSQKHFANAFKPIKSIQRGQIYK